MTLTINDIIETVCRVHEVQPAVLTGKSRKLRVTMLRFCAIWLCLNKLDPRPSLPTVGKAFNRDHTTILHARNTAGHDPQIQKLIHATIPHLPLPEAKHCWLGQGLAGYVGEDTKAVYFYK